MSLFTSEIDIEEPHFSDLGVGTIFTFFFPQIKCENPAALSYVLVIDSITL